MQLGDEGSSLSNSVTMSDNAALVFANVHDVTYGGAISGDGAVCVLGPGMVTLTGDNNYTNGTYIFGGTLSISSDDTNLGNSLGGVGPRRRDTETTAGITSNRAILVNGGGTILDTAGVSGVTFDRPRLQAAVS